MKVISRVAIAISLALVAPTLMTACSGEDPSAPQETGSLTAALSGVSAQGFQYRLRQGTFTVVGPTPASINTEDHLGATAVTIPLQSGSYTIALASGWQLERNTSGVFAPVAAALVSANPAAFDIANNQATTVEGDDVSLGGGDLQLVLEVDDTPVEDTAAACADGLDNDGDNFVDCVDFNCAPFCGGSESTAATCSDGVDNDGDSFIDCVDFNCAPFCGGSESTAATCSDGVDNDGDTFIDCVDFNCDSFCP
jgi:hypothetical protein